MKIQSTADLLTPYKDSGEFCRLDRKIKENVGKLEDNITALKKIQI